MFAYIIWKFNVCWGVVWSLVTIAPESKKLETFESEGVEQNWITRAHIRKSVEYTAAQISIRRGYTLAQVNLWSKMNMSRPTIDFANLFFVNSIVLSTALGFFLQIYLLVNFKWIWGPRDGAHILPMIKYMREGDCVLLATPILYSPHTNINTITAKEFAWLICSTNCTRIKIWSQNCHPNLIFENARTHIFVF